MQASDSGIVIQIRLDDETRDPTGTLTVQGEDAIGFSGWLDMLRLLESAVGATRRLPRGDNKTEPQ